MWRYSVLRKPGLMLSKDMKMKIYSIAGLYSSVGYVAEQRYIDEDIFVSRHIAKPLVVRSFLHLIASF